MLILHTSDWHLGRSLHRADLMPAFELWCDHVVELTGQRELDAVLISGDVYDRGVPPAAAVELFDKTLARLADLTTVIVTAGNHDSPLRLGFGSRLMRSNVHIRTDSRLSGVPVEVRSKDGKLGALVYPIPYLDPDVERARLAPGASGVPGAPGGQAPGGQAPGEDRADQADGGEVDLLPRSHEAVLKAVLELVAADVRQGEHAGVEAARIVMAHAFITGGQGSPSERDISVGGVDCAPSSLFRLGEEGPGPLAYVALGHLHSPQQVGRQGDPPMRYSGSPVAFSFSETAAKSSVLLHIEAGRVDVELIKAPVWRKVRTLEGTLAQLEQLAGIGQGQESGDPGRAQAAGGGHSGQGPADTQSDAQTRAAGKTGSAWGAGATDAAPQAGPASPQTGAAGAGAETSAAAAASTTAAAQTGAAAHSGAGNGLAEHVAAGTGSPGEGSAGESSPSESSTGNSSQAESPANFADDFVRVILTDPHRPLDMSARIRRAFPNVLEIQHRATAEGTKGRQEEIATMKPKDVLALFMETAGNRQLERAESELLAQVWDQVMATRTAKARS